MDVLGLLLQLIFRAIVVVLPTTVGFLAFRRLMLSQSSNAWIYAATCLFTSTTAIGLLPWAVGLASGNSVFFLFAAVSPMLWIAVVMVCDSFQATSTYESNDEIVIDWGKHGRVAQVETTAFRPRPLVLEKPEWPEAPVPIFRHTGSAIVHQPAASRLQAEQDQKPKTLLSVAQGMRGNKNSDARRPKMLPAPTDAELDLPFLPNT